MANPFYVAPLGGLSTYANIGNQIGGAIEQSQLAQQQAEQQEQLAEAQQAVSSAFESGDVNAIRQAMIQYPEMAEQAKNAFGFTNEQTERVARETYRRVLSDPENAPAYMQQGIQQVAEFGGRPTMMTQDLQMLQENPEAALQNIRAGYAALATEPEFQAMFPETMAGAGQPAGVREFESLVNAAQSGDPTVSEAARIRLGLSPRAGMSADERIAQDQELAQLVGELERLKSGEREAGQQAVQQSGQAFEKLQTIKSSLPKYDRAIQLVKQGANTGALANRFPSLLAETVELESLQRELGLDVISAVTFGALSEAEMEVALQTALPTQLEGPELIDWLERKKASQEKLADYLADAAQFLGRPGNTVADWMALAEDRGTGRGSGQASSNQPQRIRLDAQGNIIQ